MRLLWERLKLVVEPSGATAFAAVRSEAFQKIGIKGIYAVFLEFWAVQEALCLCPHPLDVRVDY